MGCMASDMAATEGGDNGDWDDGDFGEECTEKRIVYDKKTGEARMVPIDGNDHDDEFEIE